jgi:hypothetical protein
MGKEKAAASNTNNINNINKEEKLIEWAGGNPYLKDALKLNWLAENLGSCSVVPVPGEASVEEYMDGSCLKHYDFIFQVMLPVSEATDGVNIGSMFELRQWQNWIDEMQRTGNYPDFGGFCYNYELQNLANTPSVAQSYDNGTAKYQFPARLIYTETKIN